MDAEVFASWVGLVTANVMSGLSLRWTLLEGRRARVQEQFDDAQNVILGQPPYGALQDPVAQSDFATFEPVALDIEKLTGVRTEYVRVDLTNGSARALTGVRLMTGRLQIAEGEPCSCRQVLVHGRMSRCGAGHAFVQDGDDESVGAFASGEKRSLVLVGPADSVPAVEFEFGDDWYLAILGEKPRRIPGPLPSQRATHMMTTTSRSVKVASPLLDPAGHPLLDPQSTISVSWYPGGDG